jgi:hypothetical protein
VLYDQHRTADEQHESLGARLYEIIELDELAFSGHIGGNRRLPSWPFQSAAITA